jgi:hypothetical protein
MEWPRAYGQVTETLVAPRLSSMQMSGASAGPGEHAYARGEPILRMTGVDGQHASAGFALP